MIYQRNSTSSKSLIYYELHIFSIANVLVSDFLMSSMNNKQVPGKNNAYRLRHNPLNLFYIPHSGRKKAFQDHTYP